MLSEPVGRVQPVPRLKNNYFTETREQLFDRNAAIVAARMVCMDSFPKSPEATSGVPYFRGTSLIINTPLLGPYSGTMPRALRWSWGGKIVQRQRWCRGGLVFEAHRLM